MIPGRPSRYKVEVEYKGELKRTEVLHEYDDGALILIAKALDAITTSGELFQPEPFKLKPRGLCDHGVDWDEMPYSHYMEHKTDHP